MKKINFPNNETDYGLPAGWGNNEIQLYTDNAGIENDGELSARFIRALSDGVRGFISAKMITKNLFSMRVALRLKCLKDKNFIIGRMTQLMQLSFSIQKQSRNMPLSFSDLLA